MFCVVYYFFFLFFFLTNKYWYIFLFLHENIWPFQGASNEYPQHIFLWGNKKKYYMTFLSYGNTYAIVNAYRIHKYCWIPCLQLCNLSLCSFAYGIRPFTQILHHMFDISCSYLFASLHCFHWTFSAVYDMLYLEESQVMVWIPEADWLQVTRTGTWMYSFILRRSISKVVATVAVINPQRANHNCSRHFFL